MHSSIPVIPSCNYYGNPAHKASECNISSKDLFCDYCGKEGHQEAVYFAKFLERKQLPLSWQNLPRYTRSLDTSELSVFIAFSFLITIGKVCMLKSETSLLGVNNVIMGELPSPFNNSCFVHSLFRACFVIDHVI